MVVVKNDGNITVRELIEKLQGFDPNKEVVVYNGDYQVWDLPVVYEEENKIKIC